MDVRKELGILPKTPRYGENTHASISVKTASQAFPPLVNYDYHASDNPYFAREICSQGGFGPENEEDLDILNSPTTHCPLLDEYIGNEGDVRRFFYRSLSGPLLLALKSRGLVERAEAGPTGNTQVTNTVDCRYTLGDQVVLTVEHKRPYMITDEWRQAVNPGLSNRNKLSKELRM